MASLVVLSTAPSLKVARQIARSVLAKRLAACVNITSPVESHFWWQGKQARELEVMMVIKTTANCYSKLEKAIRQIHPYEVPEIIALPIRKASKPYLDWIARETRLKSSK